MDVKHGGDAAENTTLYRNISQLRENVFFLIDNCDSLGAGQEVKDKLMAAGNALGEAEAVLTAPPKHE